MDKYTLNGTSTTIAVLLIITGDYCGIILTITIIINNY